MYDAMILIFKILMWTFVSGMALMGAWVLWVYLTDLPSHSEMTDEDEKRIFAELNGTKGIRASEIGGNDD